MLLNESFSKPRVELYFHFDQLGCVVVIFGEVGGAGILFGQGDNCENVLRIWPVPWLGS
jgi:hypothetical protein